MGRFDGRQAKRLQERSVFACLRVWKVLKRFHTGEIARFFSRNGAKSKSLRLQEADMKSVGFAIGCAVLCAILSGCSGGFNGHPPPQGCDCEELARQLEARGWELWVVQEGGTPRSLQYCTEASPLRAGVDTWFMARVKPGDRPARLICFRDLPDCACDFCLKGGIDQEEPDQDGSFSFRYDRNEAAAVTFEPGRWMTTRGVRLCICEVEVALPGDPYSFWAE